MARTPSEFVAHLKLMADTPDGGWEVASIEAPLRVGFGEQGPVHFRKIRSGRGTRVTGGAPGESEPRYKYRLWKRVRGGLWHWQVFRHRAGDDWEPGEYGSSAWKTVARLHAHDAINGWRRNPANSLPEEEVEVTP